MYNFIFLNVIFLSNKLIIYFKFIYKMASITINPVSVQSVSQSVITGNEKLIMIDNSGKPGIIEVEQILDKVDDKINDVIEDQIDDRVDNIIDDKVEDALDEINNLTWNEVT